MKKLLAILLVLCMVIPAAALGEEVVKIGVYEPATGDSGAGGKQGRFVNAKIAKSPVFLPQRLRCML